MSEAEPVVLDLVQRAVAELMPLLHDPLSQETLARLGNTLQAVLSKALALGERHRVIDSDTAREELRHVLAEIKYPLALVERTPDADVSPEQDFLRQLQHRQFSDRVMVLPHGTTLSPSPNLAALSRLLWLLDLSEGERAFVRAAADQPSDLDGLAVFADWLEEQQRVDSERFREVALAGMRRLNPQLGEVYVVRRPGATAARQDDFTVAYLHSLWHACHNGASLMILDPDESLSMLTDEQLAAAGLVRKERLAEKDGLAIKSTRGRE